MAKTIAVEYIMAYNYFRPSFGSQTERAKYQYRYSYLQLFWHTTFVKGMSKKEVIYKYISALYSNKINIFVDIVRFLKNRKK